ncbi:MAG: type II toxin-antitoxin system VapB family antitoxin [Actinomycetota bacterium]|nr:type II toxin-antitoxin system VapB family antitoxin [Actinomycetota bacterium]
MRTTITIHDELLEAAKRRARERGQTLGGLVEDALRREISLNREPAPRISVPVFDGGAGPLPGVDLNSNRALHELLDEGMPFEKLR